LAGHGCVPRVWFHGASGGEIECIADILSLVAARWPGVEIVLTVFSESGRSQLDALAGCLESAGGVLLYRGFCPWEGHWLTALDLFRPDVLVTAKYEAWPDLWSSLAALRIPLAIVSARARTSLRFIRRFLRLTGGVFPELVLSLISVRQVGPLRNLFPDARIEVTGDPRWDRVLQRKRAAAAEMLSALDAARRWIVLGSVWPEDLHRFRELLAGFSRKYGVCVIPHKVDGKTLGGVETALKQSKLRPVRLSSGSPVGEGSCLLVDRIGLLAELYGRAEWAYVGGGFGRGVHNLLEPAAYGIPVACGPAGTADAEELAELRASGQLTVVASEDEIKTWLGTLDGLAGRREEWRAKAEARQGASGKVVELLAVYLDRAGVIPPTHRVAPMRF
jgi:3-deoxy-D-manno-octulosonic-acid transferase